MEFGEFLYIRRTSLSISPKELAEKVGCHPTFVRGIERGVQYPSMIMARTFLFALGERYEDVDPFTLRTVKDGYIFEFKITVKGLGGKKKTGKLEQNDQFRIDLLEARVAELEKFVQRLRGL